jgi:PAS domain S-box-containing protein
VVFANQSFSTMTGYSLEEVIGGTATLLDGPKTGRNVPDILRHNIAEGHRFAGETVNYRKDGSEFIMDWAIAPIVNDEGCPTNYVAIQRDVTERHRAGQRLAESQQRMELALWGADLGLWDYAPNTGRATYDQRWAAMLGYKVEGVEPTFNGWASLVHPEDFPFMKDSLDRHLNGNSAVFEAEFRMRSHAGEWRWILSRGKVVERLPDGTAVRATGTHLDVTARREAEIALRHSNEDLQQFAYAVSHDLQEPLRMMAAYSGLLRDHIAEKLDPDGEIFLSTIQDGARRASRLVTDLLKYASAGADERDRLIEICALGEILDAAMVLLTHRIDESGAVIERDPLPEIDANRAQIEQLFYNLLNNALKYSRPNEPPRIRISSQKHGGQWIISVHDNGTGFDPNKAEYIFGVFKRLEAPNSSGTGIGLALCRRIVERHGGRIWAESQPGVGSVFSFKLPARVHAFAVGGHQNQ